MGNSLELYCRKGIQKTFPIGNFTVNTYPDGAVRFCFVFTEHNELFLRFSHIYEIYVDWVKQVLIKLEISLIRIRTFILSHTQIELNDPTNSFK